MTWNYRVVEIDDGEDEPLLVICEVYYHEDGRPRHFGARGATVDGGNYTELDMVIGKLLGALKKPRLKASDFVTE